MLNPRQLFTQLRHDLARMREAKDSEEFKRCKSFAQKDFAKLRDYMRVGALDEHSVGMLNHSANAYLQIVSER